MSHDTGAIRLRPRHDGRRFGIPDSAWSKLIGLLEDDPRITRIRVFGSRATGHFRQGSDIDLCIDADVSASHSPKVTRPNERHE